jgi:hypothetical protein
MLHALAATEVGKLPSALDHIQLSQSTYTQNNKSIKKYQTGQSLPYYRHHIQQTLVLRE